MNDEELKDEELEDSSSSFERGYDFANNKVNDLVDFYNDYKQIKNNNSTNNQNNDSSQNSETKPNNENVNNSENVNNKENVTPNQNTENVNDLVMKDRLNSLKNGGNNITKESLKKAAKDIPVAQYVDAGLSVASAALSPNVDADGNELEGIDAVENKSEKIVNAGVNAAGNLATDAVIIAADIGTGGAAILANIAIKEAGSKASSQLANMVSKPISKIIGFATLALVIFLLLIASVLLSLSNIGQNSNTGTNGAYGYIPGYENCNSITITAGSGGSGGTYDLDTYVAGVIAHENNWRQGDNIENMKAQAVAARTYALIKTNNCTTPIVNSTSSQTFTETNDEYAIKAAKETSGIVVTKDSKLISTEYDALAIKSSDNDNYYLYQANLQIPKSWLDQYIGPSSYEYYANHYHGRGMSQWGSRYLQTKGYTYDKILLTFYDGELSSIIKTTGLGINGEFAIRKTAPNIGSAPDNQFFNASVAGTNWFQCPWYTKGRAIEILSTITGIDESRRTQAINAVKASRGNGSQWYDNSQNGGTLSMFASSTDYTKPKPGAIVSWKWSTSNSQYTGEDKSSQNFGHVGIIESVNEEKQTVTISDGWQKCSKWNDSSLGCMGFSYTEYTFEQIRTGKKGQYVFLGYVYLLD